MYFNKTSILCQCLAYSAVLGHAVPGQAVQARQKKQPNLIVIMTDEHSYLTLGCYRQFLPDEQVYRWGANAAPKTPNIDRLAKEGAIYTSYYASSPVSSPSRASFFTGCYPERMGVALNGCGLRHDAITFGQVLKDKGYSTTYIGKWHMADNEPIPGWQPTPSFGFDDNTYMFNTAHQKYYIVGDDPKEIVPTNKSKKVPGKEVVAVTPFLTDKAIDVIKRDHEKPFCLILNIPDPHSPDIAVPPYDTMYEDMEYQAPKTMFQKMEDRPMWARFELDNEMNDDFSKKVMINYFGMCTDIDDNIGRVMKALKKYGIDKNTIVMFTSDHGDLNFEHHRINKGLPYETSARIPMIVRYPDGIRKGKVISTPTVNIDAMPTMLALMGAKQVPGMDGTADAQALTSRSKKVHTDRIVYVTSTFNWVMATDGRYKLVLSTNDSPWLYDLEKDPLEMGNCYEDAAYADIAAEMMTALRAQMKQYGESRALDQVNPLIYK